MRNQTKDMLVVGFALFSMFFGAGNVIFPPYLGMGAGENWLGAFTWYYIADIGLALVALFAMLRINSDIAGITGRIGKIPSVILSTLAVLCIGPFLAIPRTAATTFEMSIMPLLPVSGKMASIIFSIIFFAIVYALSVKESAVIDIVGKILTPALFIGLLILIIKGIISPLGNPVPSKFDSVIAEGVISGYQTLDVLASLIFGVILLKTVIGKGYKGNKEVARVVGGAGIVAGIALLVIYCGLTYLGATVSSTYGLDVNRSVLVVDIVRQLLGQAGIIIFAVVVALACLTTAIALTSSCGAYFNEMSNDKYSYRTVVIIVCIFSAVVSNIGLDAIISVAAPILNIIYPAALTCIILSYVTERIHNDNVFKLATLGALVISIGSQLIAFGVNVPFIKSLPLSSMGFEWILPAIICGIIGFFIKSPAK